MLIPHGIFYAVLLINTVFSVRFFMSIIPRGILQLLIDAALVLLYIVLAASIGQPLPFAIAATCLFILATCKYAAALGTTEYDYVLRRKIFIDALGVLLCLAFLLGTLLQYEATSAWGFTIVFVLANMYLLFIKPMYRL